MTESEPDPVVVYSDRCGYYEQDGHQVEVCICRLEGSDEWSLEVVDEHGTSTVWDASFSSDEAAWNEFLRTVAEESIEPLVERVAPITKH